MKDFFLKVGVLCRLIPLKQCVLKISKHLNQGVLILGMLHSSSVTLHI
jgi:hypothetical protein